MENWIGKNFESSSETTQEFRNFARDYKKHITKVFNGAGLTLASFNRGHFYISGFALNPDTKKYAYFSIHDVRGGQDDWLSNVLVRSAEHIKDYRGGSNGFASLPMVGVKALSLTQ